MPSTPSFSANIGLLTLDALSNSGAITFSGLGDTFQALSANANNGIAVNVNLTTTTGDLSLNGDADNAAASASPADNIVFSSAVVLTSAVSITLQATTGMSGSGTLDLDAVNGVTLDSSLASLGVLTINADTNKDGSGTFTAGSGTAISTSNKALNITAADVILTGTLDSGTATTTIQSAAVETIGVGDGALATGQNITFDNAKLAQITSGGLTIGGSTTSGLTVDTATTNSQQGLVTLLAGNSGANVVFSGGGSTFSGGLSVTAANQIQTATTIGSSGGQISFHAPVVLTGTTVVTSNGGNIVFDGNATIDSQPASHNDLTLTAGTGNVSLSAAVGGGQSLGAFSVASSTPFLETAGITAQTVSVNSANGVTFDGNVTTTGVVTVNADSNADGNGTFTVGNLAAVSTGSQAINITAADVSLDNGTLDSGSATTTIQSAAAETIGIGNAAGSLVISDAELSNITAATLVIGGATTTGITVSAVNNPSFTAHIGLVTLDALTNGGKIIFSTFASTFSALSANANNGIAVHVDLTTTTGDLSLNGDFDNVAAPGATSNDISFDSGVALTSAGSMTLQATTGKMSSGTLDLNAVDGVTLDSSLAATGVLSINADTNQDGLGTFTVAAGAAINTTNNALNITAADVTLLGTLNSGTATTTIQSAAVETIGVGDGPTATGQNINFDNAKLAKIFSGSLSIGGATTSGIAVDTATTTAQQGLVTLLAGNSGANVVFAGVVPSTFQSLSVTAANQIQTATEIDSSAGDIGFHSPVILTGATTVSASGGNILFDSQASVDSLAATSQNLTLTAGTTGSVTFSAAVGTAQSLGAFSVTSSQSFLESQGIKAQTMTVNSANGVILSGNVTTTGALNVNADTNADGNGTFTVGGGAAVNTTSSVLNITAADVNIAGTLDSGTATTTIQSAAPETIGIGSVAANLMIDSVALSNITAAALVVGGATTTSISVATVDNPSFTANIGLVTLDALASGGKITFSSFDDIFQALSANADNGITVQTNLTTQGAFTANADVNADGFGTFSVGNLAAVNTTNNSLNITAADVALTSGTLNSGTASTTIQASDGETIGLGNAAGQFTLNGSAIAEITSGALVLGGSTTGSITVNGLTDLQSGHLGPVTLLAQAAGSSIIFNGAGSTFQKLDATAAVNIQTATTIASTGGHIALHSPVILNGATSVTSAGGSITFDGAVDSAAATHNDLTLSAGSGAVTFTGAVGLGQSLGNLSVDELTELSRIERNQGAKCEREFGQRRHIQWQRDDDRHSHRQCRLRRQQFRDVHDGRRSGGQYEQQRPEHHGSRNFSLAGPRR